MRDDLKRGEWIYGLMEVLYPICRSITGDGVRQTLHILGTHIPLEVHEVPTGTQVFDWTVPKEWNIRDAFVRKQGGPRLIDFHQSNLHVLNYSMPIHRTMALDELKPHLFTLPDRPDWIPYKTSYYKEGWGFCLSHNQLMGLDEGDYEVLIDATLEDGSLTYGECFLPGASDEEILVSVHTCHPSLANDNLSGVCTAACMARMLADQKRRYSYRFLFIPGTIGAITWLCLNKDSARRIKHGLVVSGVGDPGKITYKKSRRGDTVIDQAAQHVLGSSGRPHGILDFSPYGYDERQYCSPGFDLAVGRLSRTPYGEYPEYHTSADNLGFVSKAALEESLSVIWEICDVLEGDGTYTNLSPMCEPQLGKRGLYDQIGPHQLALLWVLSFSDGTHTLLDISKKSGIAFSSIRTAADVLIKSELLK
jgi:aminopeptidase-like protein